ncbi:MAG TPA: GGDEF domain-containing protein [Verrucomicrobiae bacterium]|jgi:diguanylate cyclase (GGDEF)-like protein|nr:GGDEF domain-containing protein [Verrucomicrobiae bacterium]
MTFSTLPNLIALAVLVAVFWAISRKETTERLHLWLAGWVLVLLHFTAQFLSPATGQVSNLLTAASLDCLLLATIAFLTSVASIATNWQRQALIIAAVGAPCLAYVNGAIWEVSSHAFYYLVIAVGAIAPLVVFWRLQHHSPWYVASVIAGTLVSGAMTAWAVAVGNSDLGITVILTVLNISAGTLYWRHHSRATAGVLTTVAGFGLWGLVFPISMVFDKRYPNVQIDAEVWNIPKYLVAVGMILTLLEDQIERSNYLAYHDDLTGLPNRRLLDDRLDQALAHARRTGNKVAVLLLDLDHFKDVNDTFGHRIGDLTLQVVVAQLAERIRESDTLARSGGDEFTLVSEVKDKHGAVALVAALDSALANPLNVQGLQVRTGLSIGLALYPEDGSDPDQLHAAADKAMYIVKRAGRSPAGNGKPRLDEVISACAPATKAQFGSA